VTALKEYKGLVDIVTSPRQAPENVSFCSRFWELTVVNVVTIGESGAVEMTYLYLYLYLNINIFSIEIEWDGKQLKYEMITRWGDYE